MGIYDRDYYRREQGGFKLRLPQTMVGILVLVNMAVYLLDYVLAASRGGGELPTHGPLGAALGVWTANPFHHPNTLTHPLYWWQFITYGFVHSLSLDHVLFNMLGLFFLGPDVESFYGKKEFLRIYLFLIAAGGIVWAAANTLPGAGGGGPLIGASGGVTGIIILFALCFPRRTILLFFVVPAPAWVLGAIFVLWDLWGAVTRPSTNVAYSVHLTGALLAFLYFRFHWHFGKLLATPTAWLGRLRRPAANLRVHYPRDEEEVDDEAELSREVDRILEKIHRMGEASLTRQERRTLETASRQYQKRRQQR